MLSMLVNYWQKRTPDEIKDMVEEVDSDGSGSIEFLEFLLLMGGILKDVPTDMDLRDAFTGSHLGPV